MITSIESESRKAEWHDMLQKKTKNMKADTAIYIANCVVLIKDDVIDIAKGLLKETVYTPKSHRLQQLCLDENGKLPQKYITNADAICSYAFDMGIHLSYAIVNEPNKVTLKWQVNKITDHSVIDNWESKPMLPTKAQIIKELEEEDTDNE